MDKAEIANLKFEVAVQKLEELIVKLEQNQYSLDESIKAWETAMNLRKHCEKKLNEARLKVEKIINATENPNEEKKESFNE